MGCSILRLLREHMASRDSSNAPSTELFLIRHAQTDWNVDGRLQGLANRPLSLLGRDQAIQLGTIIKGMHFDAVVCSDLLRARETAALAGMVTVTPLSTWREIDVGRWSGRLISEIQCLEPTAYSAWLAEQADPPGGESWTSFRNRIRTALDNIANMGCQRVAVVTHKMAIITAIRILEHNSVDCVREYMNAGITRTVIQ